MTPMAGVPLSDKERMRIRVLHGRGWSATAIGKEIGRPTSTVSRAAESMDLHFDHAQTDAATRAAMITSAARASRLAERMLREAEDCLDSIHRPYMAFDFANNGENRYSEHLVMPGPAEKAQLMRAAQTGLSEYRRQTDFDRVLAGGGAPVAELNMAVIGGLAGRLRAHLSRAAEELEAAPADHQTVAGEVLRESAGGSTGGQPALRLVFPGKELGSRVPVRASGRGR